MNCTRLEPTRGCRSPLQRNAVASDSECTCTHASTTHVLRRKNALINKSPVCKLRMIPHPSLMWQSASTELPQAVVQRRNLQSCLGSKNKPRDWFVSSRNRSKPCCGSDSLGDATCIRFCEMLEDCAAALGATRTSLAEGWKQPSKIKRRANRLVGSSVANQTCGAQQLTLTCSVSHRRTQSRCTRDRRQRHYRFGSSARL